LQKGKQNNTFTVLSVAVLQLAIFKFN